MINPYVGNTYELRNCAAEDYEFNEVKLNGRFTVEEYNPIEPSAYVNSPYFTIWPENASEDDEDGYYMVDEWVLIEQIDPPAHAKMLEYEALLAEGEGDDV